MDKTIDEINAMLNEENSILDRMANFSISDLDIMIKYLEEECKEMGAMAEALKQDGKSDKEVIDTFYDMIARNRDTYHVIRNKILDTAYQHFDPKKETKQEELDFLYDTFIEDDIINKEDI